MKKEYNIRGGERGKYAKRYAAGVTVKVTRKRPSLESRIIRVMEDALDKLAADEPDAYGRRHYRADKVAQAALSKVAKLRRGGR